MKKKKTDKDNSKSGLCVKKKRREREKEGKFIDEEKG